MLLDNPSVTTCGRASSLYTRAEKFHRNLKRYRLKSVIHNLTSKKSPPLKSRRGEKQVLFPFKATGEQGYSLFGNSEQSSVNRAELLRSVGKNDLTFAGLERSYKRNMPCKYRKITVNSSGGEHLRLIGILIAVRRRYCQHKSVHNHILPAFATASSIVPTKRNADSGRSSCLPSRISLKPLIVSERGTYIPGKPVNFSETWNG